MNLDTVPWHDLEWLAHVMTTRLLANRARRFHVYRVIVHPNVHDSRYDNLYAAGSL